MERICVFCGSSLGYQRVYRQAAENLGKLFAESRIGLVYGGANVGLMKVLANSAMEHGGEVVGVMPQSLVDKEVAHNGINKLHVVTSMAERKSMMLELADAFIALPGGFGTLDELSEILTYNQLRICDKPLGLLNIGGYFDYLLRFLDHGVAEGFIREEHRSNIIVSFDCKSLLQKLKLYEPVGMGKWIEDIKGEA
jgi:uncharacterized protein (TIGR00730 family)